MDIHIKKVTNGFVVEIENSENDIYETYVFSKFSQVAKFIRDHMNVKVDA